MTEGNISTASKDVRTCTNCKTVYRVELVQEGSEFNDFGFRYCPLCGTLTDEWAQIKAKP
jgi:hypothetical protein